jgi:hypothetical protein
MAEGNIDQSKTEVDRDEMRETPLSSRLSVPQQPQGSGIAVSMAWHILLSFYRRESFLVVCCENWNRRSTTSSLGRFLTPHGSDLVETQGNAVKISCVLLDGVRFGSKSVWISQSCRFIVSYSSCSTRQNAPKFSVVYFHCRKYHSRGAGTDPYRSQTRPRRFAISCSGQAGALKLEDGYFWIYRYV